MSKTIAKLAISVRRAEQDVAALTTSLFKAKERLVEANNDLRAAVDAEIIRRVDAMEES